MTEPAFIATVRRDCDWAEGSDPVTDDLYGDLTDIYQDLKEGLGIHDRGIPEKAFHHWVEVVQCHWGRHATSALGAIGAYRSHRYLS